MLRPERGSQPAGNAAPLLPAIVFGRLRIVTPEPLLLAELSETCVSQRPFARPPRLPLSSASATRSSFPGLLLRPLSLARLPARSADSSRSHSVRSGTDLRHLPVAGRFDPGFPLRCWLPFPARIAPRGSSLPPRRIERFTFAVSPIALHSPLPGLF
jgi:hypothetical protein